MKKNIKLTSLLLSLMMCMGGCNPLPTSSSSTPNSNTGTPTSSSNSSLDTSNSTSNSSSEDKVQKLVYAIAKKATIAQHEDNKQEKENKKDEFMDRTSSYKVGDENNFDFEPQLTTIIPNYDSPVDSEIISETEWNYNVSLLKLDGEEFKPVTLSDYSSSIDETNCLIDFNEAAVGNTFKISVVPQGLTADQDVNKFTVEYTVDVVKGYNLYDEKELSYISNDADDIITYGESVANAKEVWDAFKEENGLKKDYYPSAFIMHNDLSLTKEDIPSKYFYSEDEVSSSDPDYGNWGYELDKDGNKVIERKVIGSLRDYVTIYSRTLQENEKFTFEGNYFKFDVSELPTVVREDNKITPEGQGNSHSELFHFYGQPTEEATVKNVKFDGNAPRANDMALSGGLILMKSMYGLKLTAYNNIAIRWFITYFTLYSSNDAIIEKCRLYDNFNCFVYAHGADQTIIDSEMIAAGGPAIIQNMLNMNNNDPSDDITSNTTVVNSKIESKVTGSEGWFKIYGVSALVPSILAMNNLFLPFNRTFLTSGQAGENYMNLICVNKSDSAESATVDYSVRGSFTYDNYTFNYGQAGATNPYFGAFYQTLLQMPQVPPMFETNAGGFAFTDAKTGLFDHTQSQIIDPSNGMYNGDKLCLYYSGMAIVFDYFAK